MTVEAVEERWVWRNRVVGWRLLYSVILGVREPLGLSLSRALLSPILFFPVICSDRVW